MRELSSRDPSYLQCFEIFVPPEVHDVPFYPDWLHTYVESGLKLRLSNRSTPLTELLVASLRVATFGDTLYREWSPSGRPITDVLRIGYLEKATPSGARYWVSRHGHIPLILVNAIGIPLGTWAAFLDDESLPFRAYVIEADSGDGIRGGMQNAGSLETFSCRVGEVIAAEDLSGVIGLSWSNGCRTLLHLANRHMRQIKDIVLLTPTLQGCGGQHSTYGKFEGQLHRVFRNVASHPNLADQFAEVMVKSARTPDWARFGTDVISRESHLLALPAMAAWGDLLAPFATGASLRAYAERISADEDFARSYHLLSVSQPLLLITGENDQYVSNDHTRQVLNAAGLHYTEACVCWAGHYIHSLQYQVFRDILERRLLSTRELKSTPRMRIKVSHHCWKQD